MKIKNTLILVFIVLSTSLCAQETVKSYMFGHSLINHVVPPGTTPGQVSQETSVPHWMHFLAEEAGHTFEVSGRFGFIEQHAATLPPTSSIGYDSVTDAWDSDTESFASVNFTNVLLAPSNFEQWIAPDQVHPNSSYVAIDDTQEIFDWVVNQDSDVNLYVYESWPDMGHPNYTPNGFPPTAQGWQNYLDVTVDEQGEFHTWFVDYYDLLQPLYPNQCVKIIPAGPTIHKLLGESPYNQISVSDLYEDDAPHGRPNIYFLAALTTYMAMYEEKAPATYVVDPIIHPIIRNNYAAIVDYLWNELQSFNDTQGNSRVFCSLQPGLSINDYVNVNLLVYPNPTSSILSVANDKTINELQLYNYVGQLVFSEEVLSQEYNIDVSSLSSGTYILKVSTDDGICHKKILIE